MEENNQAAATDTGADQSQVQEQVDNWGDAEAEFLADKGIKSDEQTDSKKTGEEASAQGDDSEGKKSDEEQGAGDDSKKGAGSEEEADPNADENLEQQNGPQNDTANYRKVQKEIEADNQAMQADVKKELYPDWSDDILDADGDPIKTPRDVMARTNPATGKRFTEEEATAWLFAAQEHKDKERTAMQERVAQVSDVMIDQRDQADQVKGKYGELLAKLPELRKEIFADYKATLVIDKETGLIVDAPVSMYRFFERALRPYEQYVKQVQADSAGKKQTQTEAERKQTHQDREDIHSASGGSDSMKDPEEAGWEKAAKEYYEG